MKLTPLLSLIALSQAAPIIITRVHTAPAVTDWQTYTTNTVTAINTVIKTINGPPPASTTDTTPPAAATTTSTTPVAAVPSTTSTSTPEPEPTTTVTETSVISTASPVIAVPQESSSSTSTSTPLAEPTTSQLTTSTAVPETSVPTTTSTSSTTPTAVPTTTSTSTTPVSPTTTSTTPAAPTTSSTTAVTPTTSSTSTTAASPSSTSSSGDSSFQTAILDEHNKKRDLHGVQHLVWNNTLATYAANYAANSFSCNNVQLIHSNGPYGENLAAGYVGGVDPVDAWYNEISQYNFDDPGFSEATGHFTQVVWKDTSQLGCAYVTCDNAWRQYTICEYSDSRGNIVGTDPATGKSFFAENVLPPVS